MGMTYPRFFICIWFALLLLFLSPGYAEELNFDQVLKKVLEQNPDVYIAEEVIKSKEAEVEQADVFPNPELEIGLENMGLNEIEVAVTQPLKLRGKRKSRSEVAGKKLNISKLEKEILRFNLRADVLHRCIPIITATMKIEVIDSLIQLIRDGMVDLNRRVEAGATMQVDFLRAEIELDKIQLEKAALEKEKKQLIQQLTVLWGESRRTDVSFKGNLRASYAIPGNSKLNQAIENHPEILVLNAQKEAARAEVSEKKADAAPEAAVTGGYIRNNEEKTNAGLLGFSIGLPFFDRNKGSIKAAHHELNAAEKEYSASVIQRKADLNSLLIEIENIELELAIVSGKLIPKAKNVYHTLNEYFKQGSVSIHDVLESRSEFLELQLHSVELTNNMALLYADLGQCTGIDFRIIE